MNFQCGLSGVLFFHAHFYFHCHDHDDQEKQIQTLHGHYFIKNINRKWDHWKRKEYLQKTRRRKCIITRQKRTIKYSNRDNTKWISLSLTIDA